MLHTAAVKKYAEAIFELAEEKNILDTTLGEIKALKLVVAQEPLLTRFLSATQFSRDQRQSVIGEIIAETQLSELTGNFLHILVEYNRFQLCAAIFDEFLALVRKKRGIALVKLVSAAPIEPAQLEKLRDRLKALHQLKEIEFDSSVDQSLVGGIIVRVGNKLYNGSIKAQLDALRQCMIEKE